MSSKKIKTDHKIQVQMIQKYFSTPNLPQVIKSDIYQI